MGKALDTTGFAVTAPGAAGTAMVAFATDPAAVRNSPDGSLIRLVGEWCKAQATGFTQVVYPSGNDTTRNLRFENVANQPGNMFPRGFCAFQKAQDALALTQAGSAVAGDVELAHLLMYYDDLPGIDQKLIDVAECTARQVRPVTIQGTLTATAAAAWSGATAVSAFTQFLRGNTQYAWLGYKLSAACGAIAMSGPSTGNLRVGGPGLTSPDVETVNWFPQLSEWHGLPMIPTFNTADAAGTFFQISQDENLTAVVLSLFLMELANA
jgi:hypothetical protein